MKINHRFRVDRGKSIAAVMSVLVCMAEPLSQAGSVTVMPSQDQPDAIQWLERSVDLTSLPQGLQLALAAFEKRGIQPLEIQRLKAILVAKGIPVCLELMDSETGSDVPPFPQQKATVASIVQHICQNGGYTCKVSMRMINLVPDQILDMENAYPLNRQVEWLRIEKGKTVEEAIALLSKVVGGHRSWLSTVTSTSASRAALPESLEIRNATARDALNQIVGTAGQKSWTGHLWLWTQPQDSASQEEYPCSVTVLVE